MSWYQKLLKEEISEEFKAGLYEILKEKFTYFLKTYDEKECEKNKEMLDAWYFSQVGQRELKNIIKDLWDLLKENANNSMPAHDARHAIYKVPAFALKYIESENVTGYERVGIIGALGHDFGRWSEERIFGNAGPGAIHSRMSFVLLEEFLENYSMPEILKREILYSVIQHTTGAKETDNMVVKLVVTADRDQLAGPEFILRLSHHKPDFITKKCVDFFGEIGSESILEELSKYYFMRLPGPLYSLPDSKNLYKISHTFCAMVLGDDWNKYIEKYLAKKTSSADYEQDRKFALDFINNYQENIPDLQYVMEDLLNAKNISPNKYYKEMVFDKINKITNPQQREKLAKGLYWINKERQKLDQEQYKDLERISSKNMHDQWLYWMTEEIKKDWF